MGRGTTCTPCLLAYRAFSSIKSAVNVSLVKWSETVVKRINGMELSDLVVLYKVDTWNASDDELDWEAFESFIQYHYFAYRSLDYSVLDQELILSAVYYLQASKDNTLTAQRRYWPF